MQEMMRWLLRRIVVAPALALLFLVGIVRLQQYVFRYRAERRVAYPFIAKLKA